MTGGGEGGAKKERPTTLGRGLSRVDDAEDPTISELEKVFGEEIAAQVSIIIHATVLVKPSNG